MSRPMNVRRIAAKALAQRCLFSVDGTYATNAVFRYRAGSPLVIRLDIESPDGHGNRVIREWDFLRDDIIAALHRPVGRPGVGDICLWSTHGSFTILIDNQDGACELMTKKEVVSSFVRETTNLVVPCSRKNKADTCTDADCVECQIVNRPFEVWRGRH